MNVKQNANHNENIRYGQPIEFFCYDEIENAKGKTLVCTKEKKIKISPMYVIHNTKGDEVLYKIELQKNYPFEIGNKKMDNYITLNDTEAFNVKGNIMQKFMDFLLETFALETTDVNTFVSVNSKGAVRDIIRQYKNEGTIFESMSMADLDTINGNVTLQSLKNIKKEMEDNLDTAGEIEFWHPFLKKYSWVLSQLFITPYILFQHEFCVGGQCYTKSGSINTDFGMKNIKTGNCAIIEIKDAKKPLMSKYRSNEITISNELSGAISQLLKQKDSIYKDYWNVARNRQTKEIDFEANNIKSILIIGQTPKDSLELEVFENFRNELKNIEVLTFDEILSKIELQIKIIEGSIFQE